MRNTVGQIIVRGLTMKCGLEVDCYLWGSLERPHEIELDAICVADSFEEPADLTSKEIEETAQQAIELIKAESQE